MGLWAIQQSNHSVRQEVVLLGIGSVKNIRKREDLVGYKVRLPKLSGPAKTYSHRNDAKAPRTANSPIHQNEVTNLGAKEYLVLSKMTRSVCQRALRNVLQINHHLCVQESDHRHEHQLKESRRPLLARRSSIPKRFIGYLTTAYNKLSKMAASSMLKEEPFHSKGQSKYTGINSITIIFIQLVFALPLGYHYP